MQKVIIVQFTEDREAVLQFRMFARQLWEEHISYTRDCIIEMIGSLPGSSFTVDRLMKNQEDIGGLIIPYYGTIASNRLTSLLKEHIKYVSNLVTAIQASSIPEADVARVSAVANAVEISKLLESADPVNWPASVVLDLLSKHLGCTEKQATSRKNADWLADIAAADECRANIYQIADAMATGILAKYPDMFVIRSAPTVVNR